MRVFLKVAREFLKLYKFMLNDLYLVFILSTSLYTPEVHCSLLPTPKESKAKEQSAKLCALRKRERRTNRSGDQRLRRSFGKEMEEKNEAIERNGFNLLSTHR